MVRPDIKKELLSVHIHTNNAGLQFRIKEYTNSRKVLIEFLDTGFTTEVQAGNIKRGMVYDRLAPSVFGLGYIGEGNHKAKVGCKNTLAYETWGDMFKRCYSAERLQRNPTYQGCSVNPVWFNFQVFAEWFDKNYQKGFQLDKDILVEGNKEYGPSTCMMVSRQDNTEKACAKHYTLVSPMGIEVEVYNLNKFARTHGLNSGNLHAVIQGKRNHHKHWRRVE